MLKFSIIVPCYNMEENIDNLLEMLCADNYSDYEVIYVDDCSKDNTYARMCEAVKGYPNYHVYQTPVNGGPGVARNFGLDKASGENILFCDSDDIFDISCLAKIDDFLKTHADADIVVFPYEIARKYGREIRDTYKKCNDGEKISVLSVAEGAPSPCAKVYKNSIISENNLRFPSQRIGEDACFLMYYIPYIKNAYKSGISYYTYVMRSGSLTHQKRKVEEVQTFYDKFLPTCRAYFPEGEIRMFVNGHLLSKAKIMTEMGCSSKEISDWFKEANALYPNWIEKIDYEKQGIYRKLIYRAMYKSSGIMIKMIMALRRILY